jgi:hypothetical protein
MSVYALLRNAAYRGQLTNDDEELESALDGNLCRCTGYKPILDTAKRFVGEYLNGDGKFNVFCVYLRRISFVLLQLLIMISWAHQLCCCQPRRWRSRLRFCCIKNEQLHVNGDRMFIYYFLHVFSLIVEQQLLQNYQTKIPLTYERMWPSRSLPASKWT